MDPSMRERFPDCPAASARECVSLLTYVTDRLGHDRRYAIDAGKIERELSVSAATDFNAGLRKTFRWYLDQEAWWRALLGKRA